MIELTMTQLMNSVDSIQLLLSIPLKAKVSYQIVRLAREVEKEYNLFCKTRTKLTEKYAEKDENNKPIIINGNYSILEQDQEAFLQEYNDLMNSRISLNIEQIQLNDLEMVELTPQTLINIEPYIQE